MPFLCGRLVSMRGWATRYYSISRDVAGIKKQPFILSSRDEFKESSKDNKLYHFLQDQVRTQRIKFIPEPVVMNKKVDTTNTKYDTELNSPETLPLTIKLRTQEDVSTVPKWRRLPTLGFRVGKKLIRLYRDSIQTTYKVWKHGTKIDTKDILRQLELDNFNNKYPNLTRKQFVQNTIRVTEIKKLPRFILLLFIFEELTFLLMYLRPKLGLYRCLGNGAFNKLSKTHSRPLNNGVNKTKPYDTVYSMSTKSKAQFLQNLMINKQPNWKLQIWKLFKQDDKLAKEVNKLIQYLIIDDWLILKRIIEHSSTKSTPIVLTNNELVNCILERQLYSSNEDLNTMVNNDEGKQVLIQRLICYWSFKFDGIDIENGTIEFTKKWGVNNINLFKYTGAVNKDSMNPALITTDQLNYFK